MLNNLRNIMKTFKKNENAGNNGNAREYYETNWELIEKDHVLIKSFKRGYTACHRGKQ